MRDTCKSQGVTWKLCCLRQKESEVTKDRSRLYCHRSRHTEDIRTVGSPLSPGAALDIVVCGQEWFVCNKCVGCSGL